MARRGVRADPPGRARAPRRRVLFGALALLLAVVAVLGATVEPAAAHAELESPDPASGATVAQAPGQVTLTFNEHADAGLGGVRVFDSEGRSLEVGNPQHPSDAVVTVDLPTLGDGGYVVAWRVVSADAHPISGSFTFQVGKGAAVSPSLVEQVLAGSGGSNSVGLAFAVARFATYTGLALLIGSLVFVALCWPAGASWTAVRRLVAGAWLVAITATVAGVLLQGPYAGALPWTEAFRPATMRAVLDSGFGRAWWARVALLALAVPVLVTGLAEGGRRLRTTSWAMPAGVLAVALAASLTLAGHAVTGPGCPWPWPSTWSTWWPWAPG